jgi:hypothetical protein
MIPKLSNLSRYIKQNIKKVEKIFFGWNIFCRWYLLDRVTNIIVHEKKYNFMKMLLPNYYYIYIYITIENATSKLFYGYGLLHVHFSFIFSPKSGLISYQLVWFKIKHYMHVYKDQRSEARGICTTDSCWSLLAVSVNLWGLSSLCNLFGTVVLPIVPVPYWYWLGFQSVVGFCVSDAPCLNWYSFLLNCCMGLFALLYEPGWLVCIWFILLVHEIAWFYLNSGASLIFGGLCWYFGIVGYFANYGFYLYWVVLYRNLLLVPPLSCWYSGLFTVPGCKAVLGPCGYAGLLPFCAKWVNGPFDIGPYGNK